jgi:hypothetical protein
LNLLRQAQAVAAQKPPVGPLADGRLVAQIRVSASLPPRSTFTVPLGILVKIRGGKRTRPFPYAAEQLRQPSVRHGARKLHSSSVRSRRPDPARPHSIASQTQGIEPRHFRHRTCAVFFLLNIMPITARHWTALTSATSK